MRLPTDALKVAMVAVLAVTTGAAWAGKQDKKPEPDKPAATFTARSELVLVPVIVRDKSGAHIGNLKKEDFTVLEERTEQKIAVFEEVNTTVTRLQRAKLSPGEFSNIVTGPQKPTRVTIIALDGINTSIFDQIYARQAIIKYLSKAVENEETVALIVLTRGGIRVIHDFTTDPSVLKAALAKVQGDSSPVAENTVQADQEQALEQEEMELQGFADATDFMREAANFQRKLGILATMEALQQVADAFAGVPGRKSLIWASAGFPFSIDPSKPLEGKGFPRESISDVMPVYERTWEVLNNANIALYPVDVRGLVTTGPSAAVRVPVNPRNPAAAVMRTSMVHMDTLDTFKRFADMTGGKAYYNTNDLAGAFQQAAADSSAYYMLGFYLDSKDTKPGWRKLEVKVHQSGAHVRAREGFFVTPATQDPNRSAKSDMRMALASPLQFTALPIDGRWTETAPSPERPGRKRISFQLALPAGLNLGDPSDTNHVVLEFAAVARTATGEDVDQFGKILDGHLKPETMQRLDQAGMHYSGALDLPPGDYSVRFVVRDNLSGRMGSLIAPLKVAP